MATVVEYGLIASLVIVTGSAVYESRSKATTEPKGYTITQKAALQSPTSPAGTEFKRCDEELCEVSYVVKPAKDGCDGIGLLTFATPDGMVLMGRGQNKKVFKLCAPAPHPGS